MSRSREHRDVLASERAINERYRAAATRWLEETARLTAGVTALSRSSIWVTGTPNKGRPARELHPLIGRVGFDHPSECPVEGELYVGPFFHELGEVTVVSWAAPVASLFFHGPRARFDGAGAVRARRTFTTQHTDLTGYSDDLEPDADPSVFEAGRGFDLAVPEAPRPSRQRPRPRPKPHPEGVQPSASDDPVAMPERTPVVEDHDDQLATPASIESNEMPDPDEAMPQARSVEAAAESARLRAEQLVLEIVERPKTGTLSSVLATLQPDQYELVTWPADRPLIVSGHPGTGKTIVAMHRAGFLTHPHRPGGPLERVVVVGPTDEYRDHVHLVTDAVGGAKVPVVGLPSLLARVAGVDVARMRPGPNDRVGVGWPVWSVVRRAARHMGLRIGGDESAFGSLVDALVKDGPVHRSVVRDSELSRWLLSIGNRQRATEETRFLPFLAAVALAVVPSSEHRVDHLLVDEAQDVTPLVWRVLLDLVKEGGSVSLFGDMNQRRSDWTVASWDELATDLELTDDEGDAPLRHLTTGYRTTRQILKFANQLLPQEQRANHAIRDGVKPTVVRIPRSRLVDEVVSTADALSRRHAAGIAAVITLEPKPVSDALRSAGWRRAALWRDALTDGDRTVFVLQPDRARGLEFDGVVVVEPNAFPQNLGRDGVLYTSLTRATKELHVVYSGALPKRLRPPR